MYICIYVCMYVYIWMVKWMDGCSTTIKHSIYLSHLSNLTIHLSNYLSIYLYTMIVTHSIACLYYYHRYIIYSTTHFFLPSNYCYNYNYFYCCICVLLQSLTGHELSIQGTTLPKIEILVELDILHSIAQKP